MHKRKRAGNTITRKINSTKDTAAKADKNHYISNSYLEGFIPIDTEYFTASSPPFYKCYFRAQKPLGWFFQSALLPMPLSAPFSLHIFRSLDAKNDDIS